MVPCELQTTDLILNNHYKYRILRLRISDFLMEYWKLLMFTVFIRGQRPVQMKSILSYNQERQWDCSEYSDVKDEMLQRYNMLIIRCTAVRSDGILVLLAVKVRVAFLPHRKRFYSYYFLWSFYQRIAFPAAPKDIGYLCNSKPIEQQSPSSYSKIRSRSHLKFFSSMNLIQNTWNVSLKWSSICSI